MILVLESVWILPSRARQNPRTVYIVGLPVPGAAGILISLVLANHAMGDELRLPSPKYVWAMTVLIVFLSFLMVSTIRFRSFKTLDSQRRRSYTVLIFIAAGIILIATHPQVVLVLIAYGYLASAFIGMAISRFKHRGGRGALVADQPDAPDHLDSAAG